MTKLKKLLKFIGDIILIIVLLITFLLTFTILPIIIMEVFP